MISMNRYLLSFVFVGAALVVEAQNPVREWNFDSALSDKDELVDGVWGKALLFDGYNTEVNDKIELGSSENFSITAWVAPQEYSWNKSAIINQQEEMQSGFFLGIDDLGKLNGGVAVSSGWVDCISEESLPLLKWSQVSMTVQANKGISLYINGQKVAFKEIQGKPLLAEGIDVCIGKTQNKLTPIGTERATSKAIARFMYFDGLMDELRIFKKALSEKEMHRIYSSVKIGQPQPLKFRTLPSGTDAEVPFGAYYTKLKYTPAWDSLWRGSDMPDIIVRFGKGNPTKLVFWRGTGYIPALVTENNIWMTDQSVENFGTGECYEAMGDKQCRYSHVRIIENTPARVVIHWRYALAGIKHQIFEETETRSGDWVDEYWTAYPDGVVVRNQILWSDFQEKFIKSYQFQETIFFNQPGTRPQDNVDYEAITFVDMQGEQATYSWKNGVPKSFETPKYKPIQLVNTKSVYKPFGIYCSERITNPFRFGWTEGYSTFPCWNHWPVAQIASDGRNSKAPDKVSHSSLTQVNCDKQIYERRSDNSVRVRSLMGLTRETAASLLPLARSWNNPADVEGVEASFKFVEYDKYQRCYKFKKEDERSAKLEFSLNASESSPVENIALEIENWKGASAKVSIDGKELTPDTDYYVGYVPGLDSNKLIVWINRKATTSVCFKVES